VQNNYNENIKKVTACVAQYSVHKTAQSGLYTGKPIQLNISTSPAIIQPRSNK